ncbi:NADH-quinone oxidoreductase subunit N [Ornithinimicrobium sp. Y1847]|uniref:NADH-quinone oxidoreductase subunit N n=1 Tax=unclassified Ornithinimicrobium TaxID=2615080 RepID=UPI003B66F1BC
MRLDLNLLATAPVLAPVLAAVLVLVLDAIWPRQRTLHLGVAAAGLALGAAAALPGLRLGTGDRSAAFCLSSGACSYVVDRLTASLQVAGLLAALVVLVLAWRDWAAPTDSGRTPVVVALLLGATAGVVAVPAAGDLGTLLVSLELATLPTIGLVALTHPRWTEQRRAGAIEGSVALLTTSLVSFALLAMGAALWVAATGTALLPTGTLQVDHPPLLVLAAVFAVAGLAFKVSAVPFHAWTPITYAHAPLPVTGYLATVSKVAALGALVVLVRALGRVDDTTLLAIALLAALSMTIGNLVALTQRDTVRLLAWSTVAQAGWVLLPLATLSARAVHAAGSYLLVYVAGTLLAFVVVIVLAGADRAPAALSRSSSLESHRGLIRSRPLLALPLSFALLTLAGLPPAVVGLVAKVVALRPVVGDGMWWLAIVAAVNVALGIAVYVRWIAVLMGRPGDVPPEREQRGGDHRPEHPSVAAWVLVGGLTLLLVLASIVPVGII